jgi:hypothetical protein
MSIEVTVYVRPNGRKELIEMSNVSKEAEKYFKENNVKISLEDLGVNGSIAAYFDDGGEEDDELVIISFDRSCETVMDEAVEKLKQRKQK